MHLAHSVHFSTASHPSANRHGTVRSAPYCNKYSAVTMARQRQQLQPGKRPRGRLQGLLEARCSAPPTPCRPLAVPPLSVLTVCAAPRAASSASRNRRSWSRSPSSAISSTSSQWMRCRRGPGGGAARHVAGPVQHAHSSMHALHTLCHQAPPSLGCALCCVASTVPAGVPRAAQPAHLGGAVHVQEGVEVGVAGGGCGGARQGGER